MKRLSIAAMPEGHEDEKGRAKEFVFTIVASKADIVASAFYWLVGAT